jgi:lysyl-tRNA synthetase class I
MSDKIEANLVCPHCGDYTYHIINVKSDELICYNDDCGKLFDIEINYSEVKVVTV